MVAISQPVTQRPYRGLPVVTVVTVGTAAATRIDTGLSNRVCVSVHNLGDFGLWLGFSAAVAVGSGEFLPGSPSAGARLGGFWSENLGDQIPVWAISEGGSNTVVVVEYRP